MNEGTNQIVQELSGIREELKQIKQISLDAHYPEKEHETIRKILMGFWNMLALIDNHDDANERLVYYHGVPIQDCERYRDTKRLVAALEERLQFIESAQRPRKMVCDIEIVGDIEAADGAGTPS